MIFQGLKLTLLGMMVVFSFLVLLLIIIQISAKLLSSYSKNEATPFIPFRMAGGRKETSPDHDRKLAAIISAALAAHRARSG